MEVKSNRVYHDLFNNKGDQRNLHYIFCNQKINQVFSKTIEDVYGQVLQLFSV